MTNVSPKLNAQTASHAPGRVSSGEQDLFAALGEQLKLDPELAKLLNAQGELPDDFQAALKNMSFDEAQALVDKVNQQSGLLEQKQGELNQKIQNLLPENVLRLGGAPSESGAAEQALLGKKQSLNANNQSELAKLLQSEGKAVRNAEDASRQFMPERKSIFAVQKQAANQNTAQATGAQVKEGQLLQNNQGLVDLNQFMAQQSSSSKDRALKAQYKNEQESILTNKAFEQKQGELFKAPLQVQGESASLKEWGHGQEQLLNAKSQNNNIQGAQNAAKVFDMGALTKNSDVDAVITQIQDYIVQAKAAKEPSASMRFNHAELGDVDIFVQKGAGGKINVVIGHQSAEAAKFFQQHQGELMQSLNKSGVQVGEFKLESSSSNNNNNQNSSEQSGKQFANQNQSGGHHKREGAERREELWSLLREERKSA